jgi:hypothetical protein
MKVEIEVGDNVAVNFNGAQTTLSHSAEVLRKPVTTGDSWAFRDNNTGAIHYVSEGCTITLQPE